MSELISTNIRLPQEYIRELKLRAIGERKSMGQLFREAMAEFLGFSDLSKKKTKSVSTDKTHPLASLAALGESGIRDSARTHDQHLYGKSKSAWK